MKRYKSAILVAMVGLTCLCSAYAATLTLDWNAVSTNADGSPINDLAGYAVFRATTSFQRNSVYISTTQAILDPLITRTNVTAPTVSLTVSNLANGATYYFRMSAYDSSGNMSAFNQDAGGFDVQISTVIPRATSSCDVNNNGSTDVVDVQLEVLQALQINSCSADLNLDGRCDVIDVQRVVISALGGSCVVGS